MKTLNTYTYNIVTELIWTLFFLPILCIFYMYVIVHNNNYNLLIKMIHSDKKKKIISKSKN